MSINTIFTPKNIRNKNKLQKYEEYLKESAASRLSIPLHHQDLP